VEAQVTSIRVRTIAAIVISAVAVFGLIAYGAQSAEAKVAKGPAGLKFYKPPKDIPRQHGTLIWARKAGGLVPLANARYTKLSSTPPARRRASATPSPDP
jgi:hypothetical protein